MQTSKFLFVMGAVAVVGLALQVLAAPDNEEQAKMRAALRQAMEQSQPPETAPASAVQPPVAPAPVQPVTFAPPPVAPAPVAPVMAVTSPQPGFELLPPPADAAAMARAREVMRLKMLEIQATPESAGSVVAGQPSQSEFGPLPPPDAAALAREREAVRVKMLELQAAAPTTSPSRSIAAVNSTGGSLAFPPIEPPASPLSPAKQAKLADLLIRYKADAITAQDYHAQRAAILSAP